MGYKSVVFVRVWGVIVGARFRSGRTLKTSNESDTHATMPVGYCSSIFFRASSSMSFVHEVMVECSEAGIE